MRGVLFISLTSVFVDSEQKVTNCSEMVRRPHLRLVVSRSVIMLGHGGVLCIIEFLPSEVWYWMGSGGSSVIESLSESV